MDFTKRYTLTPEGLTAFTLKSMQSGSEVYLLAPLAPRLM